jgi:chloramphenicol O-acetyltransferase type A
MAFTLIDFEHWARKEHYLHFIHEVCCSYSVSVNLDISNLKGHRLYPAMLWLLTRAVNQMPEFRTALTDEGLGCFDEMHPAYTIFHPDQKTFSGIWTEYQPDYPAFLKNYESDAATYASSTEYAPKPGRPPNSFDVSMAPWFSFTAFHIHVSGDGKYLLPIFTMGKYVEADGKRMLPLAIQVHHAVCDGYHVGKFIEILQAGIDAFEA